MKILYSILAVIAAGNISVAIFLTMLRIEKNNSSPKGVAATLYFVFTMLGLYAAKQLFF